jgi:hypothetical protein
MSVRPNLVFISFGYKVLAVKICYALIGYVNEIPVVLGTTLNCIHPPPQGTNKDIVPVLSREKGGRFARWVAIHWQEKTKTIGIRKNHDTSDRATPMLQDVMMWSRHAPAGQDRPVERVGGEDGTHTGIDPGCPSCLFPNILFKKVV